MSKQANIDEFWDAAIAGIRNHRTTGVLTDEELNSALIFLSRLEKFAQEFNMELLRSWAAREYSSLDLIDFNRKHSA